jgi:hypothetical protein
LNDIIRLCKILALEPERTEAKVFQCSHDFVGVLCSWLHKNIYIAGIAGCTVKGEGVGTGDEILNLVCVE